MKTSKQAECAKLIRKELKQMFPNIKFRVNSRSASMMTAVDVYCPKDWTNDQLNELQSKLDKYEYGAFDGYTDCQTFKNREYSHLPQVKYLDVCHEWK